MTITFKQFKYKFFRLMPLFLLFFISLNGSSVIDLKLFSINFNFIVVYYWVLRQPQTLGYGYIFISGLINDVIFGLPLGSTSLTLLIISGIAAYVRVVTVRVTLFTDWMVFIPSLLTTNLVYFFVLYFSNYPIDYLYLFKSSIFTFMFYPFVWIIFEIFMRITNFEKNA